MKKINLKNAVWKEGHHFMAWNLNTSVSSFGETRKTAIASFKEALELYFEDMPFSKIAKVERPDIVSYCMSYA